MNRNAWQGFFGLFQFQIKAASLLARLRLLNVLTVRFRRLDPRRLDVIFDLKPELCRFQIKALSGWSPGAKGPASAPIAVEHRPTAPVSPLATQMISRHYTEFSLWHMKCTGQFEKVP
jgi:hypothetical protein